jgi:hypothetical protein
MKFQWCETRVARQSWIKGGHAGSNSIEAGRSFVADRSGETGVRNNSYPVACSKSRISSSDSPK